MIRLSRLMNRCGLPWMELILAFTAFALLTT